MPNSPLVPLETTDAVKSLQEMTTADVKAFLSQHVAPEVCSLSIAGDTDASLATRLVEQSLGGWTRSSSFQVKPAPEAQINTAI